MKKVAIFGKPGSGKSTFSKKLATATGIQLHALDLITYQANGKLIDRKTYDRDHDKILACDSWIIDGVGHSESFNQRLAAADTLIYIDLPYPTSYWLVTKRMLKGVFVNPEGWPEGSAVLQGTWQSYKTLRHCPMYWNERFLQRIEKISSEKSLHVLRSISELNSFIGKYILCDKCTE